MYRPMLPPRGIFVDTSIVYAPDISASARDTLIQLMALAWGSETHQTPVLSVRLLAGMTGKNLRTLRGHLAFLRTYRDVLVFQPVRRGEFIIHFAAWLFGKPLKPSPTVQAPTPGARVSAATSAPSAPGQPGTTANYHPLPSGLPAHPPVSSPKKTDPQSSPGKKTFQNHNPSTFHGNFSPPAPGSEALDGDYSPPAPGSEALDGNYSPSESGFQAFAGKKVPKTPDSTVLDGNFSPPDIYHHKHDHEKEDEDESVPQIRIHPHPLKHPQTANQKTAGQEKSAAQPVNTAGLSPKLQAILGKAGIFTGLFDEVARIARTDGWSEKDLLALLSSCEETVPDKPGGLFIGRLRRGFRPAPKYYQTACPVCGKRGGHDPDCRRRYIVDYDKL